MLNYEVHEILYAYNFFYSIDGTILIFISCSCLILLAGIVVLNVQSTMIVTKGEILSTFNVLTGKNGTLTTLPHETCSLPKM